MNRCPLTYEIIESGEKYSLKGLKRISASLSSLHDLPYSVEELLREVESRNSKLSIQGMQPKLSAVLNIKNQNLSWLND
jgi:serine/threonine-protein kinase HipA